MMGAGSSTPEEDFEVSPGLPPPAAEFVAARRVLLDGLEALRPHLDALVVVGAQAVYLNVGEAAGFGAPPTTLDGDVVIDQRDLPDSPTLEELMRDGGFGLLDDIHGHPRPGVWGKHTPGLPDPVSIDLIVPRTLAPLGRRAARIGPHGEKTAMTATGLEVALVDHQRRHISALEENDARSVQVNVAGVGALLVAKAFKLHDRVDDPKRLLPKDALDVVRLYQSTTPAIVGSVLGDILDDPVAGQPTVQGLDYLEQLFAGPDSVGTTLAVEAARELANADLVIQTSVAFTRQLLQHLRP